MKKSIVSDYRKSGNLLFFSGFTGEPGDAKTQISNAFERMKRALQEAGSSLDDVLSVTVFIKDLNDRPTFLNPLWERYFPSNSPARTTVQVELGPDIFIEMAVVAQTRTT